MIQIPPRLKDLLDRDQELSAIVSLNLGPFERWFEISCTPFFPEYTDHGPRHVDEVLKTASSLVADQAWDVMSPDDAAVLVLGVLLHDAAMHLTEDGFLCLVGTQHSGTVVDGFTDEPWPDLWREFLAEASRFDGRKLMDLFGSTEPVRHPPAESQDWSTRDKLLIGEFVRRGHPRIAHEIALTGVPGPGQAKMTLKDVPAHVADLSGLIARSHGSSLRSGADYLAIRYRDKREFKRVHGVFLMGVLRVSDYLQVQAERGAKERLQVSKLRSPVSKLEWQKHHAITDIRFTHPDPECVWIDAHPQDVKTYIGLQSWLSGIQAELDGTWATLGEVYGEHRLLRDLGLAVRRVRSNLDDSALFEKTVNYVPCHASFDTANADLLKLMVGPLYGGKPEIGIRELVQNGVDAVLELQEYLGQSGGRAVHDFPQLEDDADVLVSINEVDGVDGPIYWLIVSDRGIGMTVNVIRDYFLRAGASYRRSDQWRMRFEQDVERQVIRSGRFGVGLLSAFLLGDTMHVSTRHADAMSNEGIEFSASLDTDAIELRRCERPIGTTISIRLSREVYESLTAVEEEPTGVRARKWDWWCLAHPRVVRKIHGNGPSTLSQRYNLFAPEEDLPYDWRRVPVEGLRDVQWTYPDTIPAFGLVCNGILVSDGSRYTRPFEYSGLRCPSLSVFDPKGRLPLNLQRDHLTVDAKPLVLRVYEDVVRDLIAYALLHAPEGHMTQDQWYIDTGYPGLPSPKDWYAYNIIKAPFFCTSEGFAAADISLMRKVWRKNSFTLVPFLRKERVIDKITVLEAIPESMMVGYGVTRGVTALDAWGRFVLVGPDDYMQHSGALSLEGCSPVGTRLLVPPNCLSRFLHGKPNRLPRWVVNRVRRKTLGAGWEVWETGICGESTIDFDRALARLAEGDQEILAMIGEWFFDAPPVVAKDSALAQTWTGVLKDVLIPFERTARERLLVGLGDTLQPYFARHKAKRSAQERIESLKYNDLLAEEDPYGPPLGEDS